MGGWLSTEEPQPEPRRTTTSYPYYSYNYEEQASPLRNYSSIERSHYNAFRAPAPTIQVTRDFNPSTIGGHQSTPIYNEGRQVTGPIKSKANPNIFNLQSDPYYLTLSIVTYIELPQYDMEYIRINRKITNKRNFKVDSIEKIENPYLKMAYELKKAQKQSMYANLEERLLFHGTKRGYVDPICKLNFNWRKCKAHKYGKGISFSSNSTYASNYSDKYMRNKIMIVAKVLVGKSCLGHQFMELPNAGCDTSHKDESGIVTVKYEDSEFYPAYKINYHLMQENVGTRRRPQIIHHN